MKNLSWLDAHLDLAYLAMAGRDMNVSPEEAVGHPQPAAVTLRSLAEGNVRWALGTIYTGLGSQGPGSYQSSADTEAIRGAALPQLDAYRRWEEQGSIRIVRTKRDLEKEAPLRVILLMEGADPIQAPEDAQWWFDKGVRAVGMAWANGTRYAGGNGKPGPLTGLGRELALALDELGMIHDLTHLSDDAALALLDLTNGPAVASHSNCRTLVDATNQRHLSDALIGAIGERGGIVGLNLCSRFLTSDPRRATIDETVAHVLHVAAVMGRRDGAGLGSDMDGGFGADLLPDGINRPADLGVLAESLASSGWSDGEVQGFASSNWLTLLKASLPH